MFDINGDQALTFEEFMFATSAQNFDNSADKLGWLFDNVYDRVTVTDVLQKFLNLYQCNLICGLKND